MERPLIERSLNQISMITRSIYLYCSMFPQLIKHSALVTDPNKYNETCFQKSRGMYVIIHGLLGTPKLSALSIAKYLDTHFKNQYEILVPYVPHKGNCSLHKACEPILKIILDYIDKNPTKPLHFIGSSNGGRIVAHLEIILRTLRPDTKIRITSVAGVYYGSNSLYYLKKLGIAYCILDNDIRKSLTTGSDEAKSLIENMQFNIENTNRSYEFYATANDWYIPNFDSCMPIINSPYPNVIYHELITGVDHVLLGHWLAPEIIKNSVIWMNSQV